MINIPSPRVGLFLSALTMYLVLLSACDKSTDKHSVDMKELREQITFDIPASVGKWEIFETPEDTGGVPGPTDYLTLIAEFEDVSPDWMAKHVGPAGKVWVAPESPRPWLSPAFKSLIESAVDDTVDLTKDRQCHPYQARIRKSGRIVEGFACSRAGTVLVYLTLLQPGT